MITATRIAAPSWPTKPYVCGVMMGSPSVCTLANGAIVAVATTLTADVRRPAKIDGSASGSSILRTISMPVMPWPRAASTVSRSTCLTPTYVFVMSGGIASRTSTAMTFV